MLTFNIKNMYTLVAKPLDNRFVNAYCRLKAWTGEQLQVLKYHNGRRVGNPTIKSELCVQFKIFHASGKTLEDFLSVNIVVANCNNGTNFCIEKKTLKRRYLHPKER